MLVVAKDLQTQYEKALDSASISRELRPHFRKWLRFYFDFCSKYGHSPRSKSSLPLFMAKLASKNQPEAKRNEASVAVTLYFKMADTGKANALFKSKSESDRVCSKGAQPAGESPVTAVREAQGDHAAAALMPRKEFLEEVMRYPAAINGEEDALRKLAFRRIKARPEAILRRLVELGRSSRGTYRRKRREWLEKSWYTPPQGKGGPALEVRTIASAGRPFVSLVLDGYRRNVVSSSEVSDYLGMQLKYLDRVARQLAPGPGCAMARHK